MTRWKQSPVHATKASEKWLVGSIASWGDAGSAVTGWLIATCCPSPLQAIVGAAWLVWAGRHPRKKWLGRKSAGVVVASCAPTLSATLAGDCSARVGAYAPALRHLQRGGGIFGSDKTNRIWNSFLRRKSSLAVCSGVSVFGSFGLAARKISAGVAALPTKCVGTWLPQILELISVLELIASLL